MKNKLSNFQIVKFLNCIVIVLLTLSYAHFTNRNVWAQQNDLLFTVTEYETREDLDLLFAQSMKVFEYLEGVEIKGAVFLSIITPSQEKILIRNGLTPKIIDRNPDLNRYVFLYHPKKDQSSKLSRLGKVFAVTEHHTLLKLSGGKEFKHEGVAAEFFRIPLLEIDVTPLPRLTEEKIPTPTFVKVTLETEVQDQEVKSLDMQLLILYTLAFFAFLVFVYYIVNKRKKIKDRYRVVFLVVLTALFILGLVIIFTLVKNSPQEETEGGNDIKIRNVEYF